MSNSLHPADCDSDLDDHAARFSSFGGDSCHEIAQHDLDPYDAVRKLLESDLIE